MPGSRAALEVGVGTGRFAANLGVRYGVEPLMPMAVLAAHRGVEVSLGRAEALPFTSESFDAVLFVTTLCFVRDPLKSLQEANRVLKVSGLLVVGMLDEDSPPGKPYSAKRSSDKFYIGSNFYPVSHVIAWILESGFDGLSSRQTIFNDVASMTRPDEVRIGHGDGLFVVLCARKTDSRSA